MTSIAKLLELEGFYRNAFNKALAAREAAQVDVDFWLNELNMVKRKGYAAGYKGNIFKESTDDIRGKATEVSG